MKTVSFNFSVAHFKSNPPFKISQPSRRKVLTRRQLFRDQTVPSGQEQNPPTRGPTTRKLRHGGRGSGRIRIIARMGRVSQPGINQTKPSTFQHQLLLAPIFKQEVGQRRCRAARLHRARRISARAEEDAHSSGVPNALELLVSSPQKLLDKYQVL